MTKRLRVKPDLMYFYNNCIDEKIPKHVLRLPIVQGGTFTFLAPTFALLAIPRFSCPDDFDTNGWGNMTFEEKTEEWQIRMREVQGAICISSIFQVIFGYFGNHFNHFKTPSNIPNVIPYYYFPQSTKLYLMN